MPTYQYSCTECGHFFEQFQSFSEDSLTACPACDGRLRKVFNAVGVVFKGSGFYRTDSRATRSDGETKPAGSASADGSSTSSAASSSGDGASSSSGDSSGTSPGSRSGTKPASSSSTPAGSAA